MASREEAARGDGGRALGLTTTASFIGTLFGMLALAVLPPLVIEVASGFTSYEFNRRSKAVIPALPRRHIDPRRTPQGARRNLMPAA